MKEINRVVLIVLDACGIGEAPDAVLYGDAGANTLKHVIQQQSLNLPNLCALGLYNIDGTWENACAKPIGCYGQMRERSAGKDTTTGHWEISGIVLEQPFPTFPDGFPDSVVKEFEKISGRQVLGNKVASGTAIIEELGEEHLETGKLIVYTSADSVFQIAAHEEVLSAQELWQICKKAREMLAGEYAVGRVIARPFVGKAGSFVRTGNRRDFSLDPTGKTVLDLLKQSGRDVLAVGKIEDIFNHRGITESNHASGNEACVQATIDYLKNPDWRGLLFANLVDTDMLYGHRNDAKGFAQALEAFDASLPEIQNLIGPKDMLIITADHGCDPTFPGTDHTRENVPLLVWGPELESGVDLGTRSSFCDVAITIARAFNLNHEFQGDSFYDAIISEK